MVQRGISYADTSYTLLKFGQDTRHETQDTTAGSKTYAKVQINGHHRWDATCPQAITFQPPSPSHYRCATIACNRESSPTRSSHASHLKSHNAAFSRNEQSGHLLAVILVLPLCRLCAASSCASTVVSLPTPHLLRLCAVVYFCACGLASLRPCVLLCVSASSAFWSAVAETSKA